MNKMFKYIAIVAAAFITSVVGVDRMPQLATVTFLSAVFIYFVNRKVKDRKMKTVIIVLFLVTFLLQVGISLFLYNTTLETKYYGFSYKGDDYVYGDFGTIVGDLWRRGIYPSLKRLMHFSLIGANAPVQVFQLYSAAMFCLFGPRAGQIVLILNCFFHAATVVPVYFICRKLNIRNNVMIFTFFLFLFWPSSFYWSLFYFKDAMLLFSILCMFSVSIYMVKNTKIKHAVALSLLFAVIYCLREYLIVVFPIALVYFLFLWKWKYKGILALGVSLGVILRQMSPTPLFINVYSRFEKAPDIIFVIRRFAAIHSNTGYFAKALTFTYPTMLLYMPLGLLGILFLPFLLKPSSIFQVAVNVESLFWWALFPFFVSGIYISFKNEFKKMFIILVTFFYWLCILALTQGSMGTLLRQKSVIYYIGFLFIALAVDRTLKKAENKR